VKPIAPLAALFTLAVLAMAWAASAHVCARPLVMDMSGMSMATMPGMDMASGTMPMLQTPAGSVMLCPVVVGLIVLSTLLGAWSIVTASRDRHRTLTLTLLVRALARLPVLRTFGALVAAGALAIAAIVAVDGHGAFSLALAVTLAALLGGIAIGATIASLVLARCILALCARLLIAVIGAIAERRTAGRTWNRRSMRAPRACVVAIVSGRGLRAPPLPAH
jgi:hypothetical protein